ncbi:hypothetical protein D046_0607A, partial [Vibrio parahaemolyticus V-223/04]
MLHEQPFLVFRAPNLNLWCFCRYAVVLP